MIDKKKTSDAFDIDGELEDVILDIEDDIEVESTPNESEEDISDLVIEDDYTESEVEDNLDLVIEDAEAEEVEDTLDLVIEDTESDVYTNSNTTDDDRVDLTELVSQYDFDQVSKVDEDSYFDDVLEDDEEETLQIDLNDINLEATSENSDDANLRKLELTIARLNKERSKVDVEETRQELISMLNSAIVELKGYINNNDSSLIMEDEEDNNKLLYHDDVNREYFEQLITWFRREYIQHCSMNKPYTAEMFINSNIKKNLLALGNRLETSMRYKIAQLPVFRPVDLLSSEYLVKQLELKIKEDIETINSSFADKDKLKSEKSNLVVSLAMLYLPNNFRVNGEYVLVKSITLNDGEHFVCGKCGETSKASQPFYLLGILPFQGVDNPNKATAYTTVNIPGVNECPHCHARNMLSADEIKRLSKAFVSKQKQLITDFVKASRVLCTGLDFTRYRSDISTLTATLPNIYIDNTYSVAESKEQDYSVDYSEAYKRYLSLINYFKSKVDLEEIPTEYKLPYVLDKDTAVAFYPKVSEPEVFRNLIGSESGVYNTRKFTKIICKCLGVNYTVIKNNAINSLINSLVNSKLYRKIAFTNTFIPEVVYSNAGIVDYLETLDDTVLTAIITDLRLRLNFDINKYVIDNKVDRSKLKQLCKDIRAEFEKKKELYQHRTEEREYLINSLLENTNLLSFTPLVTISSLNEDQVKEFRYDSRLVDFINQTSDLMILNNLSYDFLDFISPKFGDSLKNNFEYLGDLTKYDNLKYGLNIVEKLNLFTFQPRTKKTVKEEMLRSIFTAISNPDFENLLNLDLIKKAYDNQDEFSLMRAIKSNEYFITQGSKYQAPIFNSIKNTIVELAPIADKFLEEFGNIDVDNDGKDIARIVYYLGHMFSVEEIKEYYTKAYDSLDFTLLLERKDGETLLEYMDRLILARQSANNNELIPYKAKFEKEITKHAVVLENCNLPMLFLGTYGKHPTVILTIIEVFYQLLLRDLGTILDCIKLDKGIANKLADGKEPVLTEMSKEKEKARLYLKHTTYLDTRFNFTGNNADLVDLDKFSGEAELDLEVDSKRLLNLILTDEDRFNKATKHLPKEVIDLIHEHYTFGERED